MKRAERLMSNAKDMDAVVIMNGREPFLDSAFWYLTGLDSGSFEGSIAIVSRDGTLDIITGKLEETCARNSDGNVHVYETREQRNTIIANILKGAGRIGMNVHSVTYAGAEFIRKLTEAKIMDATRAISGTMAVKDDIEIGKIREACRIASKTAMRIPDMLSYGITEKEVAGKIDLDMRDNGADGNSFETIAAFGSSAAEPHHRPSDIRLRDGDTALFDFGCKYGMYCSDLTRTVFFGEPDEVLRRAYDVVMQAKIAGMNLIKDGAAARDVDIAARNIIDDSEFKGRFIHSFGHGVGMDVHEGISVSHISNDVLKENMVITAEPGIYIPGVGGIRVEDTVLVKKNGYESLTKFDQSFTVIS